MKCQLLKTIGGDKLAVIFHTEIGMGLLGEILEILNQHWNLDGGTTDYVDLLCLLDSLSHTNRFSLSLQFLSQKEKDQCQLLFTKLGECCDEASDPTNRTRASEIKTKYLT